MRKKSTFKTVNADVKIMDAIESHPDLMKKLREPYEYYYRNIKVGNYRVSRYTYGSTTLTFSIKYPGQPHSTERSLNMPVGTVETLGLVSYRETARRIWISPLQDAWENLIPTFNRKMDNWIEAVLDNRCYLDRWEWILGTPEKACVDILVYLKRLSMEEYYQDKAREAEFARAMERVSSLQKDFKHLPQEDWHSIVDLAFMSSVHR